MERKKELVTFSTNRLDCPNRSPTDFFSGPSVNETARLSRVALALVKHTTGRFVSSLFSECREIRAGGTVSKEGPAGEMRRTRSKAGFRNPVQGQVVGISTFDVAFPQMKFPRLSSG